MLLKNTHSVVSLGKLCSKIWQLCSRAVLTKNIARETSYYARETSYYAHENSYYARTTKIENPVLLGKTQKIVHFSFLKHNTL